MKIIVNNNAIERTQMRKEVAKPSARSIMEDRMKMETTKATNSWYRGRIDPKDAARNAKEFKKNYERTCPETLSGQTKDILWKKAKKLKDEFTIGMLSKEELHPVKGFQDKNGAMKWVVDESKMHSLNSVQRNVAWESKNQDKIREFKNIMRHLDPENPNAGDIERFRPKKRGIR